jgi:hypothetical protein
MNLLLATGGRDIGMLQPARQISVARFCFQHNRSARELEVNRPAAALPWLARPQAGGRRY